MPDNQTRQPCSTCGKPWSHEAFRKGNKRQCRACWKAKHDVVNQCCTCAKPWSESEFHKGNRQCKQCRKDRHQAKHGDRAARYAAQRKAAADARRQQRLEDARKRKLALQERRATAKQRKKEYYENNKAVWQAYGREYFQKNKEQLRKRKSEWLKNNPDKRRAKSRIGRHRRRAKERGAGGRYTAAEAETLFAKQRGKCVNCGMKMTIRPGPAQRNLDHVQPLALDGSNSIDNLQWLCQKCNNEKGAMDPYEWAKLHGRLFT